MKQIRVALALLLVFCTLVGCSTAVTPTDAKGVIINEVMANNQSFCLGHVWDWVELYNGGSAAVSLEGYYLTDDMQAPTALPLKGTTLEAGGYTVVTLNATAPFHLAAQGETLYLTNGEKSLEEFTYGEAASDKSYDAAGECAYVTPGFANTKEGYEQYQKTLVTPALILSEILPSNGKFMPVKGKYYDIVEVQNVSQTAISLSEYSLSDKKSEPTRYPFPEVTLQPGEVYLVYCSGEPSFGNNHASFQLSVAKEETVYLAKQGEIFDKIDIPADIEKDQSYGRLDGVLTRFSTPSLGKANQKNANGVAAPTASVPTGLYETAPVVSLKGEGTIYYTTNGSKPTTKSKVYSAPLKITTTTTIRAICVKNSKVSEQAAFTYVVGQTHELPVVHVSLPKTYINGKDKGILNHIDKTFEYECQLTLIEKGEEKFSLPCGFRLHGYGSREMPKQNFQLRFRSQYGPSKLRYKLFENHSFASYDSLLLKGGSEDWGGAVMRDEVGTTALDGATALSTQAYKPVVLYLGGEYWGVYYLRERFSDDYVASHFEVSEQSVDLLTSTDGYVQDGSNAAFKQLRNYVQSHDMTQDKHYNYLCSQIDANSLMDWYICRSYMGDKDLANIRRFRSTEGDGKWRWMYFDLDWAFCHSKDNPMSILNDSNGEPVLIRALLKNAKGKDAFLKRYAYLMSTVLNEKHMVTTVDKIAGDISSEMKRDRARWGRSVSHWEGKVQEIRDYFKDGKRDAHVKKSIQAHFKLSDAQMKSYFG